MVANHFFLGALMDKQVCEFCQGELVTVKGQLICTNCGLINKTALENKERYTSPTFFSEKKLRSEKFGKSKIGFVTKIKQDISYISNYLELSPAVEKLSYDYVLNVIMKERMTNPKFPWVTKDNIVIFNSLIAFCVLAAIKKIIGKVMIHQILRFYQIRGELLSIENLKDFLGLLTKEYDFITCIPL